MRESHHGREYIIGAIGALAEYLALRYGMNWLAWLAMFLLWLALVEYAKRWTGRYGWRYVLWLCLFIAMALATYYLIQPRSKTVEAKAPAQSNEPPKVSPPYLDTKSSPVPDGVINARGGGSNHISGNTIVGATNPGVVVSNSPGTEVHDNLQIGTNNGTVIHSPVINNAPNGMVNSGTINGGATVNNYAAQPMAPPGDPYPNTSNEQVALTCPPFLVQR